jgi:hypothetical protein
MVNEGAALLDRPVTPVTPSHFSTGVYSNYVSTPAASKSPAASASKFDHGKPIPEIIA